MRRITTLKQAINLALGHKGVSELDADLEIEVDDETWNAYSVFITHRDILFLCDKGTATFLVDSYGDRHVAELFDWNPDDTKETTNE